jgi:hypothetical protein
MIPRSGEKDDTFCFRGPHLRVQRNLHSPIHEPRLLEIFFLRNSGKETKYSAKRKDGSSQKHTWPRCPPTHIRSVWFKIIDFTYLRKLISTKQLLIRKNFFRFLLCTSHLEFLYKQSDATFFLHLLRSQQAIKAKRYQTKRRNTWF